MVCHSLENRLIAIVGLALLATGSYAEPWKAEPWAGESSPPIRWTPADLECPDGAERRRQDSRGSARAAVWCEISNLDGRVARHGPYLELLADGTAHRQGYFLSGKQSGRWITWRGEQAVRDVMLWPGEASWILPTPEEICPPGSERDRSYGWDHKRRMWSQCLRFDDDGEAVRVGPYVTWDIEIVGRGHVMHLRELVDYVDGQPHGRRLKFGGKATREWLMLDETWVDGVPSGLAHAYFRDGTLREIRHYVDGRLDGERRAFHPDGTERWVASYEAGALLSAAGDVAVDGQPCPDGHLPEWMADGRREFCSVRVGRDATRHGAFAIWDEHGQIVERGLYAHGEKAEVWDAPADAEPLTVVEADRLVAEGILLVDGRPLVDVTTAEARLWTRNTKTREFSSGRVEIDGSMVRLFGLAPGTYYAGIEVDVDPSNPLRYPGDLTGSHRFEIERDTVTQLRIPLAWTLHLVEPIDSNQPQAVFSHPCDDAMTLSPATRFAWRPPGARPGVAVGRAAAGTEYHYRVHRVSCDPWQQLDVVAEGTTTDTLVDLWLPANAPGEVYSFTLGAEAGGAPVGKMMSFGTDASFGWDLRFQVRAVERERLGPADW